MPTFTPSIPYEATHPDALAVYCSDGRFTRAVEALLAQLGYPRLDTLTIPGGPGLLELTTADLGVANTIRESVSFLVTGHKIKHVVLVAHAGCGYYKHRLPYESPESMLRRQVADLRGAAHWIKGAHGAVEVNLFYARSQGPRVEFEAIE